MPPATLPAVAAVILITGSKPNGPTQAANTASELKGRTLPAIKEPRKDPNIPSRSGIEELHP